MALTDANLQSRHWDGNRRGPELYFETTVVFPESASDDSDKIRQIKGFQTDVPNSPHHIGDLRGLVDFQSLDIKGTNAGIYAEVGALLSNCPLLYPYLEIVTLCG
jgi:hypothetical protein